jgi:hypothetical protein
MNVSKNTSSGNVEIWRLYTKRQGKIQEFTAKKQKLAILASACFGTWSSWWSYFAPLINLAVK